jgi:hypothetical protein
MTGRFKESDGSNVGITAGVATLNNGNVFHLTDATTLSLISGDGWTTGSTVRLIADATTLIAHNAAVSGTNYPILLTDGVNKQMAANDIVTLTADSTRWIESGYSSSAGGFVGTFVMTLQQLRSTHWTPWPFDATCTYRQIGKLMYINLNVLTGTATSGSNYWDGQPFVMIPKAGSAVPYVLPDATSFVHCTVQNQGDYEIGAIKMDSTRWTMLSQDSMQKLVGDEFGTASGYMGWPCQTIVFTVQ